MKIKTKLITALAILAPITATATPYVDNVDLLNAGVSAIDGACLLHAPFGAPLQTKSGEFLNFRRCLESNNYTDFRKQIPLATKVGGEELFLAEMSTLTIPHHSLLKAPAGTVKQLFVPPLLLVGKEDSIGVRPIEVRTARNYFAEQKKLVQLIKQDQIAFEQVHTNTELPITTVSVFAYRVGTKHKESSLIYMLYSKPDSILIKKINAEGVTDISEEKFISEANLLVNPLFKR